MSIEEYNLEACGAMHAATMVTRDGLGAVVREAERLTTDWPEPEAFVHGFLDEALWLVTVADQHVRGVPTRAIQRAACG